MARRTRERGTIDKNMARNPENMTRKTREQCSKDQRIWYKRPENMARWTREHDTKDYTEHGSYNQRTWPEKPATIARRTREYSTKDQGKCLKGPGNTQLEGQGNTALRVREHGSKDQGTKHQRPEKKTNRRKHGTKDQRKGGKFCYTTMEADKERCLLTMMPLRFVEVRNQFTEPQNVRNSIH